MKRRRYLNRVSMIILSLVFIPIILLTVYFWQRSTRELDHSNQTYYEHVVRSFAGDFEQRLGDLQSHAISIKLDSKTDKSIFHEGVKRANEHPYWYYLAVQEMQELYNYYYNYYVTNCGIYYYDLDRAITTSGIFTKQFFLYGMGMRDPTHHSWEFFDIDRYESQKWIFSSTNTGNGEDAYLLAGYCTELGKNKDKVVIIYTITADNFAKAQSVVYGESGINFHIKDESGKLDYLVIGGDKQSDGERYSYKPEWLSLSYEIGITEDFLQASNSRYYRDIEVMLIILGLALIVSCCVSIIVVYKPIFSLTSELESPDLKTDEFGNIRNALGDRHAKIMEQENMIMDLLLKHLIHGVPISQKMLNRLGIAQDIAHYCTFVIDGFVLPASIFERLADYIESLFSSRLFCTNWQGENRSILILFMPKADVEPIENEIRAWLEKECEENYTLTRGEVVDELNGIQNSFLSCLKKDKENREDMVKTEVRALDSKDKQQQELTDRILEYLEKQFMNKDLGQLMVADEFQISTYTLSRLFKNRVGIGFTEYVNFKRLEYAKSLLLTTSLPIKEIALRSGYASETYFGRIFKATYGVSPSQYKEE